MTALAAAPDVPPGTMAHVVTEIPVDLIDIGTNVRVEPTDLEGLAASIKAEGLAQAVQVVAHEDGRYRLVYGQRRLLAARLAGLPTIRAEIVPAGDVDEVGTKRSIVQLAENLLRADLNAIEEAVAFREVLAGDPSLTQASLAERLGISPSRVSNSLRLLETAPEVQDAVRNGKASASAAKALAGLPARQQKDLLGQAIQFGYSAHEMERRSEQLRKEPERQKAESEERAKKVVDIVATVEAKAPKDVPLVVTHYYGQRDSDVAAALRKAGWKAAPGSGWSRKDSVDCDCREWIVDLTYNGARVYPGCVKDAHRQAKYKAEQQKDRLEREFHESVRATLRDRLAADVAALPPLLARVLLYEKFGWQIADWAKAHKGDRKKPDAWASLGELPADELAGELTKRLAEGFTDNYGIHLNWEAIAAELEIGHLPTVQAQAAERVKGKRAARVAARTETAAIVGAPSVADQSDAPICSCGKPKIATGDGRWVCTNPDHPAHENVVPSVGDAVVSDGVKFRIRELAPNAAHLSESGPHWRTNPVTRLADPGRLTYDREVGVWRGPSVEAAAQ